ncbi:MAG: aminodeoxychorismate synthase, component I [Porticoccaceae bacterium]|nr:aminodeoxychorismate synthase, component I [Porticoccaceae bacterium]
MICNEVTSAIFYDLSSSGWMEMFGLVELHVAETAAELKPVLDKVEAASQLGHFAIGYICYEAASGLDTSLNHRPKHSYPLAIFAEFEETRPIDLPVDLKAVKLRETIDKNCFSQSIGKIREHLKNGDTYQVNFTHQLIGDCSEVPLNVFAKLIQAQPTPYGIFFETEHFAICSASPELFFSLKNEEIEMKPMKGTRKRGRYLAEDLQYKAELGSSEKDRAENLMILDMVRNDLGRICQPGSIKPSKLFEIHKLPTVWQQTSSVTGKTEATLAEIFSATFPCASITGAPKIKAMEIISELEIIPRGVYTGTLGYLKPNREASFNVAIRTMFIDKKARKASYGVGGGIVWDSKAESEWEESLLKAQLLDFPTASFELFETMRYDPHHGVYLLEEHISRLNASCDYFGWTFEETRARNLLEDIKSDDALRIKLLMTHNGEFILEKSSLPVFESLVRLKFASRPIDSSNIFLFHKTTHRRVYEEAKKDLIKCDDVILFNEKGELTETTIANLYVEVGDKLMTPPLKCGVLPGALRASMLSRGMAFERVLYKADLLSAKCIYVGSSLRGLQKAILCI